MKRFLILSFCVALTFAGTAQSIELDQPVDVIYGFLENPEDNTMEAHWDVINGSSEILNVRVYREILVEVPGSQERFCWAGVCFNWGTDESPNNVNFIVEMEPGEVDTTFRGDYEHLGNLGVETIKYCFYDHYDSSIETCHEVDYNVTTTGIGAGTSGTVSSLGSVSPNPVKGIASFEYNLSTKTNDARIVIYNLVGEEVKTIELDACQGIVLLSAADFESGVYFYALEANGKVLGTKKLVISK